MDLQIRANGTTITPELRAFIDKRTAKIEQSVGRITDAQLELRTVHQRTGGDMTTAQLTLQTGRHTLRAEERDHDPARAVDEAVNKLVRQIRKFKDKRVTRKTSRPEPGLAGLDEALEDEHETDGLVADGIVRTKRFSMKPMSPDEAVDQLELLGHDFFLFLNADEDQMNVVYRRRDGNYGLLQPQRT